MFVIVGNIDSLISAFNANVWFWSGSTFLGLIIMRVTLPHQPRPFKVSPNKQVTKIVAFLFA